MTINLGFSKIIEFTSDTVLDNWLHEDEFNLDLMVKDINDVLHIMFKGYDVFTTINDNGSYIETICNISLDGEFVAYHKVKRSWSLLNADNG